MMALKNMKIIIKKTYIKDDVEPKVVGEFKWMHEAEERLKVLCDFWFMLDGNVVTQTSHWAELCNADDSLHYVLEIQTISEDGFQC